MMSHVLGVFFLTKILIKHYNATVEMAYAYNQNSISAHTPFKKFHTPPAHPLKSSLRFMPLGTSETIKNYISGNKHVKNFNLSCL